MSYSGYFSQIIIIIFFCRGFYYILLLDEEIKVYKKHKTNQDLKVTQ